MNHLNFIPFVAYSTNYDKWSVYYPFYDAVEIKMKIFFKNLDFFENKLNTVKVSILLVKVCNWSDMNIEMIRWN